MEPADIFSLHVAWPWLLGMLFGVFVGATPGLTATMAVALIVPISFYLPDPAGGLAMIIGVSFTAIFAGDIPATYLRIPGTPASAAATLDGHALARQGKAPLALTLDLICSALGGLVGVGLLALLAPQLARFALHFTNYEYFWLALVGLSMSALVSNGDTRKGLLAALFGMLVSTIGIDMLTGEHRFTFGNPDLLNGPEFIPAMIGLFGLSEVLRHVAGSGATTPGGAAPATASPRDNSTRLALHLILKHKWTVLKSSLLGTFIGALPGAGADIAAWGAYGLAQRTSKNPETFGSGNIEGVIAPTSANNAAVGGAWIPALVFGIPGDAVTAIVLGALLMYDIKPGPLLFQESGGQVDTLFLIAAITQFLLIPCGLIGITAFHRIMKLPRGIVMAGVTVFSIVGSFAIRTSIFDIGVMIVFGIIGLFLEARRVPLAPLILGLILGPMVEEKFRGGLIDSYGSFAPFFTRPISATLALLLLAAFILPLFKRKPRTQPPE